MKTAEELNALKEEVETLNKKLCELTEEELTQVTGGGEVRVRENESIEDALKRFKRTTAREGVLLEQRHHDDYEKPSVRREKKAHAARKKIHSCD